MPLLAAVALARDGAAEPSFAAHPSTITLPDGPGSIEGLGESAAVHEATGAVAWSMPIEVPDGPGGLAPSLVVAWNSNAPNGPLGVGGSLGTSALCRSLAAGPPLWGGPRAGDAFVFGADGAGAELVRIDADPHGAWALRVEDGSWMRFVPRRGVEGEGEGWEVRFPDGSRAWYGASAASREGSPDAAPLHRPFERTLCWQLTRREDAFGHTERWEWARHGERLYPVRVRWALDTPHPRSVRISWEPRPDVLTDWRAGYERTWGWRLARIDAGVDRSARDGSPRVLRSVIPTWHASLNASRLASLALFAEDGMELPGPSFHWVDAERVEPVPLPLDGLDGIDPGGPRQRLADLDGDGRADLLEVFGPARWTARLQRADGRFAEPLPVDGAPPLDAHADWIFVDVEGDGVRDVLHRRTSGELVVYPNLRGASAAPGVSRVAFGAARPLGLSVPIALGSSALRVLDVNHDGRPDFVYSAGGRLWTSLSSVERDAHGRVDTTSEVRWARPRVLGEAGAPSGVEGVERVDLDAPGTHLVDRNGDGIPDLVRVIGGVGGLAAIVVHEGRGEGGWGPGRELEGVPAGLRLESLDAIELVDINRDGLGDLVEVGAAEVRWWPARGDSGFGAARVWALPGEPAGARTLWADLNGNGSVDLIRLEARVGGGVRAVDLAPDAGTGLLARVENGRGGATRYAWASVDTLERTAEREGTPWRRSSPQPLTVVAEEIQEDGLGAAYRTSHVWRDPVWDPVDATFRTFESSTRREHGDADAPDRIVDRLFFRGDEGEPGGFGGVVEGESPPRLEREPARAGRTRQTVARDASGAMAARYVHRLETVTTADGRPFLAETGVWVTAAEHTRAAPRPGTLDEAGAWHAPALEPASPHAEAAMHSLTTTAFNAWGQPVREDALGWVGADGRDRPGDERSQAWTWINDPVAWRIGLLHESLVLEGDAVVSRSRRLYDGDPFVGLPPGRVDRGLLAREEVFFLEEMRWIPVVQNAWDARGNRIARRDALGHEVAIDFDPVLGMYPVRERMHLDRGAGAGERNPRGPATLETSATWDLDTGRMETLTNLSGETATLRWDGAGRIVERSMPGDLPGAPSHRWIREESAPVSRIHTETLVEAPTAGRAARYRRTTRFFDGMLRPRLEIEPWQSSAGRTFRASGWAEYAANGDPVRQWQAFEVERPELPLEPPKAAPWSRTRYDVLGRPVERIFEDGATERVFYRPGEVETWDANDLDPASPHADTPSRVRLDGHGRMVEQRVRLRPGDAADDVRDWRIDYSPHGTVASITLPDGERRRWRHDSLGRVHGIDDPNAGSVRLHLDDLGRPEATENADGGLHLLAWDAVGRLRRVELQEPGAPAVEIARYDYDVPDDGLPANHAIGRLVRRSEEGFDTLFDYDARGQIVRTFHVVDERIYTTGTTWTAAGLPAARHYLDGTSLELAYWEQGTLRAFGSVVPEIAYTIEGKVAQTRFGNGTEEVRRWDERLRPARTTLRDRAGRTLYDLEEVFDRAGVPVRVVDHALPVGPGSQSVWFEHDALHRPTRAWWAAPVAAAEPALRDSLPADVALARPPAQAPSIAWEYSTGGNLTRRSSDAPERFALDPALFGALSLGGDLGGPHHVTHGAGSRWAWDLNGRLVEERSADGVRTFAWDAAGRLRTVRTESGGSIEHVYDGWTRLQSRTERGPDGAWVERTIFFDPHNELTWTADGVATLVKAVRVGPDRVAEVHAPGDPGLPWSERSRIDPVAPWASGPGSDARGSSPGVGTRAGTSSATGRAAPSRGPGSAGAWLVWIPVAFVGLRARRRREHVARAHPQARDARGRPRRWWAMPCGARRWALRGVVAGLILSGASCGDDLAEPSRDPLRRIVDVSERGRTLWLHAPRGGTVTLVTDEQGAPRVRRLVTPFGLVLGAWGEAAAGAVHRIGGRVDPRTGIAHHGARHYEARIGQWLSPDPLALRDAAMSALQTNGLALVGNLVTLLVDRSGYSGMEQHVRNASPQHVDPEATSATIREMVHEEWSAEQRASYALEMLGGNIHRPPMLSSAAASVAVALAGDLVGKSGWVDGALIARQAAGIFTSAEDQASWDGFAHGIVVGLAEVNGRTDVTVGQRDYQYAEEGRQAAWTSGFEEARGLVHRMDREIGSFEYRSAREASRILTYAHIRNEVAGMSTEELSSLARGVYAHRHREARAQTAVITVSIPRTRLSAPLIVQEAYNSTGVAEYQPMISVAPP